MAGEPRVNAGRLEGEELVDRVGRDIGSDRIDGDAGGSLRVPPVHRRLLHLVARDERNVLLRAHVHVGCC